MNPGRFYMPNMGMRAAPFMRANYMAPRSLGLFGRISNSLRGFNWRGLLSGANKTLDVVNQTIPLIRQAGPMFNNMKSMIQLAKAFGNETTTGIRRNRGNNSSVIPNNGNITSRDDVVNNSKIDDDTEQKKEVQNSNYPSFFI